MVLNNFVKAACLSACLGLASGSILANVETNGGLHVYDSSDSDHWFNLNGKMRVDYTAMHTGQDFTGSLKLRTLEATMAGGVGENLSYSFRLKNGDSASIDKAQVTYSGFNSWSKVSVGQVSMPYGLGSTLSEDSMATQVFGPEATKGTMGVSLTAWNDKMGLMCSLTQSVKDKLTLSGFDTSARLSFAPLMRDNLILHVGANAYMQKQEANTLNSSLANGSESKVDLTAFEGDNRGFGLDAAVLRGPLFMQAEFHQVTDQKKQSAMGYNVEVAYAVTGETREYNKVKGAFSQLNSSNEGASWQVSARHSGVHVGENQHRTLGANVSWIANNNLTVLANYENMISAEKNPGALTLRLQAAW